ncbi:MAG: hypothetical protein KF691_00775 [Phycisphaeraceae bacterium]|nr:hypothetical protein [Phycisphaeraceae bacterium]
MKTNKLSTSALGIVVLACACGRAHAQELITNGSFESGFNGWTRVNQVGGDGTFHLQSGATSPVNGFAVPTPPQGLNAAMTDSVGPGTHVLYQDFVVPVAVPVATLRFSLYINNSASAFSTPSTLDWATPVLNQQARVDIMSSAADPFSTDALDILQNVFQTTVGSSLVTGYNDFSIDVTALLASHAGETLRLRFAEADNVNFFNFGVDSVGLTVPAPASICLLCAAGLVARRRTRS